MLKPLFNRIYRIKFRKEVYLQHLKACSNIANTEREANIDKEAITDREANTLDLINSITKTDLSRLKKFEFTDETKKIISSRVIGGNFKSLHHCLARTGIDMDTLEKLYDTYLITEMKLSYHKYVTPRIQPPISIVTSLDVGATQISWVVVTNTFEVLEWDWIPWSEGPLMKNVTHALPKTASLIASKLPNCENYIVNDIQVRFVRNGGTTIQKALAFSLLSCLHLLHAQKLCVYTLASFATAKFYNLFLGGEQLATYRAMEKLMRTNCIDMDGVPMTINIRNELKKKYMMGEHIMQEQVSWTLLRGLFFMYIAQKSQCYVTKANANTATSR